MHFKHETFDTLQYATDFGTISKESLKRITKWVAKYFTDIHLHTNATARVFFPADEVEQTPTASSEMRSVVSDVSVLSFVSHATVPQLTLASTADFKQVEEYESDSDDSDNDVDIESEELVIGKPIMTRSGRQVKVWSRFDV